jgi:hypothetical protein
VSDVVPTLGGREERERGRGERRDVIEGARSRGPEERFQFRERHLDRIEVRAVGRQKSDPSARGFDRRAQLGLFVNGEIVEHDDIASAQQIGRDAAFVDEDVLLGVVQRQPVAPAAPLSGDVGPPLFVGVYGFF